MDSELKGKEYQKLLKLKKQYTIIVYIGLILSVLIIIFRVVCGNIYLKNWD